MTIAAAATLSDIVHGRAALTRAATSVVMMLAVDDIVRGRAPEATVLQIAVQALGQHSRSLKPTTHQALAELRRLLSEVKD